MVCCWLPGICNVCAFFFVCTKSSCVSCLVRTAYVPGIVFYCASYRICSVLRCACWFLHAGRVPFISGAVVLYNALYMITLTLCSLRRKHVCSVPKYSFFKYSTLRRARVQH